jgi:hypothetical protein
MALLIALKLKCSLAVWFFGAVMENCRFLVLDGEGYFASCFILAALFLGLGLTIKL